MTRSRLVFVVVAALVLGGWLFARSEAGQLLMGRWSFVKSAEIDRGTYFRLKVKLTYKGEPQDFDIVVGCNVHRVAYKDGSGTYEAGLVPTVYGRRMSDGKGLVIRAPDACDGQTTANGRVPENFMPVIIVYDDADTLAFGTAYISDDAYASPLSLLTFGGATVEAATRAEFDTFRKDGPPNLVTREIYHSNQSDAAIAKLGLKKVWPPFGTECRTYQRFRIPDQARSAIAAFWPSDRPRYWIPPTNELQRAARSVVAKLAIDGKRLRDIDGERPNAWVAPTNWLPDFGVVRRNGRGRIDEPRYEHLMPVAFFPASTDLRLDRLPDKKEEWNSAVRSIHPVGVNRVDFRDGAARGFAYSYPGPESQVSKTIDLYLLYASDVVSNVDGEVIANVSYPWRNRTILFFENDIYYFDYTSFFLLSDWGDA